MERFDYFKTIEDKYKNRYSTKKPLVIRLDGRGVTKNKGINLLSLKEDSFRGVLNETAKIISKRYNCIAYAHCDEISFIFEEPEVLKQKYGIEFDWDSIDEIIGLNQKKRGQLCDIDYVISFLEEKGQKKAAQLIREYGKR